MSVVAVVLALLVAAVNNGNDVAKGWPPSPAPAWSTT
jgi:hypothetical protein